MSAYLDSSFLAKLYLPERDTPAALALAKTLRGTPMISLLSDVEVASAILRRLPEVDAKALYSVYRRNRDSGLYRVVLIDQETFLLARELVERYARVFSLRSLDAVQLASGLQYGASAFVTTDGNLAKAAAAEGLAVLRP